MANLETLTAKSLRHYQRGRLRMAARVALLLVPLAAVCLLEPVGREACACCAALLLAASIWLRFRNRVGVESVTTGLLAGGVPLAAMLLLTRANPGCAVAAPVSLCSGFSVLIGALAGALVALRERGQAPLSDQWLITLGIALLTASLGCIRLGVASLLGVALGLVVGRASARATMVTS